MRRLLATTTLALTFVAVSACGQKDEEKKDAAAKTADKGANDKAADDKAAADGKAADDGKAAEPAAADGGAQDEATKQAAPAAVSNLVDMVPEGAKIMVRIDLPGLTGSSFYTQQAKMLEAGPLGANFAAAAACNLGPATWKQAVLGVDPEVDEAVLIGMAATGIGKKENLECIATKYKEHDPTASWTIEEQDGRVVVSIDGGEATAYAAGEDMLVVAGKAWNDAVKQRVAGEGQAAASGSLKDALALATEGEHVVFAGLATADMNKPPLTGAKYFGGSLSGNDGLSVQATVVFGDAAAAKTASDAINAQFQGFKGMAASFGVPKGIVDSVKIEAKDANMELSVKATTSELEEVGKVAAGMMGGMPPM
ncbi:MAG: hypothetical protein KC501_06855 [Myxococcales bacterium]|nr:hypothetical protein [Myxococcales bacterium]